MRKRKRKNHKKKYQQTERVKERKRELELEKMKILEKRKTVKTKIYQKYVYGGDTKINKMKK